ncbi:MAG TPA: AraC family transcriptional regulator [Acidobacteriaceae bacterium]|nr:AraC family transcriptional regulator [Acidobacteriaceae bacterium]
MKPFREHVTVPRDASWVLFDRRLDRIPFEWHYHPEYELTLTLNSRGQRFVGDNISGYDHGDLVLIGPRIPHTWYSGARDDHNRAPRALVLWFTEAFKSSMIEPHVELHPILRLLERSSRALRFSKTTRAKAYPLILAMTDQPAGQRLASLLSLLLLLSADRKAAPLASAVNQAVAAPSAKEERISRVVSYLHHHYREQTTISKLMKVAALSRSSLHRLFKRHTGATINQYTTQLRVGNACALLIGTEKPISFIADEVGFGNLSNFNRQFKTVKESTPRAFRSAFHR